MDKLDIEKLASANPATAEVQDLDDWQLGLVGGGDNTPTWQDPPTP